jgi:hypothetical protein
MAGVPKILAQIKNNPKKLAFLIYARSVNTILVNLVKKAPAIGDIKPRGKVSHSSIYSRRRAKRSRTKLNKF